MTAHKWTTEPPTEPGAYWGNATTRLGGGVFLVELVGDSLYLATTTFNEDAVGFDDFTHWMRIDAPEPPK